MRRNAKEMSALLAQFRSGDLSSSAFCEQHLFEIRLMRGESLIVH